MYMGNEQEHTRNEFSTPREHRTERNIYIYIFPQVEVEEAQSLELDTSITFSSATSVAYYQSATDWSVSSTALCTTAGDRHREQRVAPLPSHVCGAAAGPINNNIIPKQSKGIQRSVAGSIGC